MAKSILVRQRRPIDLSFVSIYIYPRVYIHIISLGITPAKNELENVLSVYIHMQHEYIYVYMYGSLQSLQLHNPRETVLYSIAQ